MADTGARWRGEPDDEQAITADARAIARLHLITPDSLDGSTLATTLDLLGAGVPWVQVRTKSATDRDRLAFSRTVVDASHTSGATAVIDDRCDIALATRAAGVHVGADDIPVADARRVLGPAAVIGSTARDPDSARAAADEGASYIGAGPVYRSTTKRHGLPDPLGPAGIERIARAVSIPVVAIAGVTVDRVAELLDAGAHGVAVVAAVYGAPDPVGAAMQLLAATGEAPVDRSML